MIIFFILLNYLALAKASTRMKTVVSRRFMRGTDPIKSTWVYPKLISNSYYLYSKISVTMLNTIFSIIVLITLLIFNFHTIKRLAL